jgi:hypothetical protein
MEQWCLWFLLCTDVLKVLRCNWSYFILLQCLGTLVIDLVVTQDLLRKTVMEQWWNSDAYELSSFLLFWRFWDVIDHILSFCNVLEVLYLIWCWHKTYCQKQWWNSDGIVMRQWWDSDETVMPMIWALLCCFEGFEMSLIIFYPFAMPWKCGTGSRILLGWMHGSGSSIWWDSLRQFCRHHIFCW